MPIQLFNNLDFQNVSRILNLPDPLNGTDPVTRDYLEALIASLLAALTGSAPFDLQGSIDASSDPNYPAAIAGQVWVISVGGNIGGPSGKIVKSGDFVLCLDDSVGGDEATVGNDFDVIAGNILTAIWLAIGNQADSVATSFSDASSLVSLNKALFKTMREVRDRQMPAFTNHKWVLEAVTDSLPAGAVIALRCTNLNADIRYLQLFDSLSAPESGDTPDLLYPVWGGGGLLVLGHNDFGTEGLTFTNGITFGFSETSNIYTPGNANDCVVELGVK